MKPDEVVVSSFAARIPPERQLRSGLDWQVFVIPPQSKRAVLLDEVAHHSVAARARAEVIEDGRFVSDEGVWVCVDDLPDDAVAAATEAEEQQKAAERPMVEVDVAVVGPQPARWKPYHCKASVIAWSDCPEGSMFCRYSPQSRDTLREVAEVVW